MERAMLMARYLELEGVIVARRLTCSVCGELIEPAVGHADYDGVPVCLGCDREARQDAEYGLDLDSPLDLAEHVTLDGE